MEENIDVLKNKEAVKIKNIQVYLLYDGGSIYGDGTFDSVNEVITVDSTDSDRFGTDDDGEVIFQIPYSSVLYWALCNTTPNGDSDEDEKTALKESGKVESVNFFRKIFGGK